VRSSYNAKSPDRQQAEADQARQLEIKRMPASFTVPIIREERRPKLVASYGSTKVVEFTVGEDGKRDRG
jgi:hypothetical protein